MGQINVNPGPVDTGDRSTAAGINLIAVLVVVAFLAIVAWFLFTGPLHSFTTGGTTNINVNPPAQQAPPQNGPSVTNPGSSSAPSQSGPSNSGSSGSGSTSAPHNP
jgi:hypothetical protein